MNYLDEEEDEDDHNQIYEQLLKKLETNDYESEEQFLNDLEEEEIENLSPLLENEIDYARQAEDEVRLKELNDIYELLF